MHRQKTETRMKALLCRENPMLGAVLTGETELCSQATASFPDFLLILTAPLLEPFHLQQGKDKGLVKKTIFGCCDSPTASCGPWRAEMSGQMAKKLPGLEPMCLLS